MNLSDLGACASSKPATRAGLSILSLVLTFGLAGCASTKPSSSAVQQLCNSKDLSNTSERRLLAGGYYALRDNQLECAERLTQAAWRADPKDAYAALNMGAIYHRTGRLAQAKAAYNEAIRLDGDDSGMAVSEVATADGDRGARPRQIAQWNLATIKK